MAEPQTRLLHLHLPRSISATSEVSDLHSPSTPPISAVVQAEEVVADMAEVEAEVVAEVVAVAVAVYLRNPKTTTPTSSANEL